MSSFIYFLVGLVCAVKAFKQIKLIECEKREDKKTTTQILCTTDSPIKLNESHQIKPKKKTMAFPY